MLRWPFCFSLPVSTNHDGEIQSSVSPAGNQTENQNNPFWTAPKSVQKLHQKILRKMQKRYEDRQVLKLRLENCNAQLHDAEELLRTSVRMWQARGQAQQAHMNLIKAEFALKGISDELGE